MLPTASAEDLISRLGAFLAQLFRETERGSERGIAYSVVQKNVVKSCVSAVLVHATFDHVYLDSRVHASLPFCLPPFRVARSFLVLRLIDFRLSGTPPCTAIASLSSAQLADAAAKPSGAPLPNVSHSRVGGWLVLERRPTKLWERLE